jgi:hypothetical protein
VNDVIEQIKEELKRLLKNGMSKEEFYEMVDLLMKASALARVGGKYYAHGFIFLKAGDGYVVVKEPEVKP